jgi:ABC-2 type transport system ATP-binding protein
MLGAPFLGSKDNTNLFINYHRIMTLSRLFCAHQKPESVDVKSLFCYTTFVTILHITYYGLMDYLISAEHLSKNYPSPLSLSSLLYFDRKKAAPVPALRDISFSLHKGKILAILGKNGAGKTTLLKILATLIIPENGKARIKNYQLGKNDDAIRALIGFAPSPSERSFYWRLTGRQNLVFFASLYGLSKTIATARIRELFDIFGIDYADRRFDGYSTGMQQKFSLMRALLHDPEILLLDEPTKSLDFTASLETSQFIKQLAEKTGKTVLFTTHRIDEAKDLADIFLLLHKGKCAGLGSLEELQRTIHNPHADLTEIFIQLTKPSL